jgi:hypothetical protein
MFIFTTWVERWVEIKKSVFSLESTADTVYFIFYKSVINFEECKQCYLDEAMNHYKMSLTRATAATSLRKWP